MTAVPRLLTFLLLTLVCLTSQASAAEQRLVLDPAGSSVSFHLDATMHSAEGAMRLASGEVRFDLATGTAAGEVVIDAASAVTGSEGRDEKLHREVLESATYPEIVFRPRTIHADLDERGSGSVTLAGAVFIHGGEHEVTVTAAAVRDGDGIQASGKLDVPYVAWGMRDPSVFVLRVAKVVEVSFSVRGTLAGEPPPATAPEAGR